MGSYQPSPVVPAQAQAEIVTQPLYDAETIATSGTSMTFFDGTNANNLLYSNVPQSGQLANPKFFRVGGVRLVPDAAIIVSANLDTYAATVEDYTRILYQGYYTLTIGQLKPYLTVPNFFLPGGVGLFSSNPTGTATAYTISSGNPIFSNFFRLRYWINIPPMQTFGSQCVFPTALTLNATRRLWNMLDGEFGREVL